MDTKIECYICHEHKDAWTENFSDLVLDGKYRAVCEHCLKTEFFQCSHCSMQHRTSTKITHGTRSYCPSCFNQLFVTCGECGNVVSRNEVRSSGGRMLCMECYRQGEILSNGYKPEPKFKKVEGENHQRYMGVELEIDAGSGSGGDCHALSKEIHKLCKKESYNKYDGSLACGFEIVTHPMTLRYHMEKFPWKKIMEEAVSKGFKSHKTKTCGLHVHLNRLAFGQNDRERDFNTMKLVIFFENNWDKLVAFSRRRPEALNSWARRFGISNEVKKREDWNHHWNNCKGDGNRYHAVNLTNRNTVEIRIFRGTLVEQTFYAALELLDLLMIRLPELTFEETIEYDFEKLLKDADGYEYDNLLAYCKERGILANNQKADIIPPKIGDIVEITGRVSGFPERSGRMIGARGTVIKVRDIADNDREGVLVSFEFGEYWCRASSLAVISGNEEESQEDANERKYE